MISAAEYKIQKEQLMTEFEDKVRRWLAETDPILAVKVPFFRDGVVSPTEWFKEGNTFRPLFILKEVNIGPRSFDKFLDAFNGMTCFEFVESDFEDIKVGTLPTWKKVAKLAKGLEQVHMGRKIPDYEGIDFKFEPGNKQYEGSKSGYLDKYHKVQTKNEDYCKIINRIAVMNIKKIGAGSSTGSKESEQTKYYIDHLKEFEDLLQRQIALIDPTVIMCLGCEEHELVREKLCVKGIPWINGYHPRARKKIECFYYDQVHKYADILG